MLCLPPGSTVHSSGATRFVVNASVYVRPRVVRLADSNTTCLPKRFSTFTERLSLSNETKA